MVKMYRVNDHFINRKIDIIFKIFYTFRAPKKSSGSNATAIEAIEKIVQEKKISTKINYDVLRSLSGPSVASTNKSEDPGELYKEESDISGIFGESTLLTPELRTSGLSSTSKLRKNSISSMERKELNALSDKNSLPTKRKLQSPRNYSTKLTRNSVSCNDSVGQNKLSESDTDKVDSREIVVETGPVDANASSYENEEQEEFEDDDDEDVPQSAAELLSKHRGEDDAEMSDFEEEYY